MKKILLLLAIMALIVSGCSKTWSGLKQDTQEVYHDTKEVIHEATSSTSYQTKATEPTMNSKQEGIEVPEKAEVQSEIETTVTPIAN